MKRLHGNEDRIDQIWLSQHHGVPRAVWIPNGSSHVTLVVRHFLVVGEKIVDSATYSVG